MTTTDMSPEEEWEAERVRASDPSTSAKELINLASSFPWEVYRNQSLPLHKLADLKFEEELNLRFIRGVRCVVYGFHENDTESAESCQDFPQRFNRFLDDAQGILEEYKSTLGTLGIHEGKLDKAVAHIKNYPRMPEDAISKAQVIREVLEIPDGEKLFPATEYVVSGENVSLPPFVDFVETLTKFIKSSYSIVNRHYHDTQLPDLGNCEPGSEFWRRDVIGSMRRCIPWEYQNYVLFTLALAFLKEEEKPLVSMLIEKERSEILENQQKKIESQNTDDDDD